MEEAAPSVQSALKTLTDSLTSATLSLSAGAECLGPQAAGISLLDTKNDLLLTYTQELILLVVQRLRFGLQDAQVVDGVQEVAHQIAKQLAETRIHLERGVRPLETRLKYQVERVLKAADEAKAVESRGLASSGVNASTKKRRRTGSDVSQSDSGSVNSVGSDDSPNSKAKIDNLSYRPNISAFIRKPDTSASKALGTNGSTDANGAYRPPRIAPTAMPELQSTNSSTKQPSARQAKSRLLDEYIETELSSAPAVHPSIGSNNTIVGRGRSALSAHERTKEKERTDYEESNFIRLSNQSKTERQKNRQIGGDVFGGEDWKGLGEAGDRVARSIGRRKDGVNGALERRRKRGETEGRDKDRDGGLGMGEAFERRRKMVDGRNKKRRK